MRWKSNYISTTTCEKLFAAATFYALTGAAPNNCGKNKSAPKIIAKSQLRPLRKAVGNMLVLLQTIRRIQQ